MFVALSRIKISHYASSEAHSISLQAKIWLKHRRYKSDHERHDSLSLSRNFLQPRLFPSWMTGILVGSSLRRRGRLRCSVRTMTTAAQQDRIELNLAPRTGRWRGTRFKGEVKTVAGRWWQGEGRRSSKRTRHPQSCRGSLTFLCSAMQLGKAVEGWCGGGGGALVFSPLPCCRLFIFNIWQVTPECAAKIMGKKNKPVHSLLLFNHE